MIQTISLDEIKWSKAIITSFLQILFQYFYILLFGWILYWFGIYHSLLHLFPSFIVIFNLKLFVVKTHICDIDLSQEKSRIGLGEVRTWNLQTNNTFKCFHWRPQHSNTSIKCSNCWLFLSCRKSNECLIEMSTFFITVYFILFYSLHRWIYWFSCCP